MRYRIIHIILLFCSIFFCLKTNAADRYWVGGSGTWTTSSSDNWSTSSGGSSGASAPTSADNVVFDENSFSGASQTVTIGSTTVPCANMTWTDVTNTPTLSINTRNLDIYGNLSLSASMNITSSSSGVVRFVSTSTGNTITTLGVIMPAITFNGSGGEWSLQDALSTTTKNIILSSGTLITNNFALTCGTFTYSNGTFTYGSSSVNITTFTISGGSLNYSYSFTSLGTMNVSSGTLTLNSDLTASTTITISGGTLTCNSFSIVTPYLTASSGSIDFGSASINLTGSSSTELNLSSGVSLTPSTTQTFTFSGSSNNAFNPIEISLGGKEVNDLVFTTGLYPVKIYDGGTINNINLPSISWIMFESGKTFYLDGTLSTSAACQNYTLFSTSVPGTAATINSSIAQSWEYIQLKDIIAVGSIDCDYCASVGTTSGFSLTNTYTPQTLYWRGTGSGDGNWGTGSNWTTNSDGTSSGNSCVPTIADIVIFDANSFDGADKTVTIDQRVTAASINFTGTVNSPSITNSSVCQIVVGGDLTLTSGIGGITNTGEVYLMSSTNLLYTSASKTLTTGNTYFSSSGIIFLEDDGYFGIVKITGGELDVQNQAGTSINHMFVQGNWHFTGGTFQPRNDDSKYVSFTNYADVGIYNATTFYNLKVDNSGFFVNTSADVTISNELLIIGGTYTNTNSKTTNVGNYVHVSTNTVTASLYIASGTFNYNNNSTTGFSIIKGNLYPYGGSLNIGVSGTNTTTVLNLGDGAGSTGEAYMDLRAGIVSIVDQLHVYSDGKLYVNSSNANLKIKTDSTSAGTAGIAKWIMDSGSQYLQNGGTVTLFGSSDDNSTNAISFNSGATFTPSNITGGTIVLNSSYGNYDYPVDFGGKTLYNLTINRSGRTFKIVNSDLTLKGALNINAGTFDVNSLNVSLAGNFINNGTYSNSGSNNTLTFNGTTTISGTSTTSLNSIIINASCSLSSTSGTLNINSNWQNNGSFTHSSGTIVFNGTTTISGSSTTSFNNITVSNTLTGVSSGTFNLAGNFINNGTFTHNSGTVNFNGSSSLSGSSTTTFYNLTISGTLIGVSSGEFNVRNAFANNGTFTHNNGAVIINGTVANQSISGSSSSTFYDLTIFNSHATGVVTMDQNFTVNNLLTMSDGEINLNGFSIILGSSATIIGETNINRIYGTTGSITTTRDINAPSALDVAGMGVLITSSANLGSTRVSRGHAQQTGVNNNKGINRYYSINPTNNSGLDATLRFYYFPDELGAYNEDDLALYRSTDSTNWQYYDGAINSSDNYLEKTGIAAFSIWTIGDAVNAPLPIQLLDFNAEKHLDGIFLSWTTASETNNDFFDLERSMDGYIFEKINTQNGAGNSNSVLNYCFLDRKPPLGFLYYRLKQVDFNGDFEYSNIKTFKYFEAHPVSQNIYPNPNSIKELNISFSEKISIDKFILYNEIGEVVIEYFPQIPSKQFQIKLPNLAIGIYTLLLQGENYSEIEKLIIR